jgi:hypothetical protein
MRGDPATRGEIFLENDRVGSVFFERAATGDPKNTAQTDVG